MRWLLSLLLIVGITCASFAKVPVGIEKKVKEIVGNRAKILAVEPLPVKGLYMVFLKGNRGVGGFMMTKDGKYLIVGRLLDVTNAKQPVDIIGKIAKEKGYIKPPQPKKVDMSKIKLSEKDRVGSKKAPSIVLFFDPTCPFCKRELYTLRDMVNKGEISFYPKYFIVHGPAARKKAEEAECIREAYGNKAYFDYLLEGKKPKKAPKCNKEAISKRIDRDIKEAREIGVRGTPTWIYQGKMYVGYRPESEIKSIIDKGKGKKLNNSKSK